MLIFHSLDHMVDWYLRHASHIYEAQTHFQSMTEKARIARYSQSKETKAELKNEQHTQITQPSPRKEANSTYKMEDEIIAKVDFEKTFSKLTKREQEVIKRLLSPNREVNGRTVYGGMAGAHTAVKRHYREIRTIEGREEKIYQIIWKWEDMLVEAEYIRPHWAEECLQEVEGWK